MIRSNSYRVRSSSNFLRFSLIFITLPPQPRNGRLPDIVHLRIIWIMYLNRHTWTNSAAAVAAANNRKTRHDDMTKTDDRQLRAKVYKCCSTLPPRDRFGPRFRAFFRHAVTRYIYNNRHPTCYRASCYRRYRSAQLFSGLPR